MQIGNRIKSLRLQTGYTQKELSEKIGLTPKMISFYEKSERTPPIDIVLKLVSIFNVSSDYLLGISDNPEGSEKSNNTNPSVSDNEWLQLIHLLPADAQLEYKSEIKGYLKAKGIKLPKPQSKI